MFCVGPSRLVFIIFVASIVDGGHSTVLEAPSGLLPAMLSQRLYAPFQHLAVFDRSHGPTAEAFVEGGSHIMPSFVEKISSGLEIVSEVCVV